MSFKRLFVCILAVVSLSACLRDDDPSGGSDTPEYKTYTLGTPSSFETQLEGLSAICLNEAGNGVLYIANQSKPKRVYTYSLTTKEWATAFDADWATSLSDLCYDKEDGTLWITDAKTQKLTQLKADGTKLQDYDISFVKKPEGFCKDPVNKKFWFVCDQTSRLYSVSYQ